MLEASQGAEALLVRERRGPVHLLVTDVVLPDIDGPELARRLAAAWPEMKMLFVSDRAGDAAAHHGLVRDAAVLRKPFSADALARKVREVLDALPLG